MKVRGKSPYEKEDRQKMSSGRIAAIFCVLKRQIQGELKSAIQNGMQVGKGIFVMGGGSFGSEPYLVTLGDYVRIFSKVSFITHNCGIWAFRDLPEYAQKCKENQTPYDKEAYFRDKKTYLQEWL